jgi:hypothetical protein
MVLIGLKFGAVAFGMSLLGWLLFTLPMFGVLLLSNASDTARRERKSGSNADSLAERDGTFAGLCHMSSQGRLSVVAISTSRGIYCRWSNQVVES